VLAQLSSKTYEIAATHVAILGEYVLPNDAAPTAMVCSAMLGAFPGGRHR
jgi:hypothetical protein